MCATVAPCQLHGCTELIGFLRVNTSQLRHHGKWSPNQYVAQSLLRLLIYLQCTERKKCMYRPHTLYNRWYILDQLQQQCKFLYFPKVSAQVLIIILCAWSQCRQTRTLVDCPLITCCYRKNPLCLVQPQLMSCY